MDIPIPPLKLSPVYPFGVSVESTERNFLCIYKCNKLCEEKHSVIGWEKTENQVI